MNFGLQSPLEELESWYCVKVFAQHSTSGKQIQEQF